MLFVMSILLLCIFKGAMPAPNILGGFISKRF
jgi:hypothetical protein